jgi:hypothetical protein
MKMATLWGYRLPIKSSCYGLKASYKYYDTQAVVSDMSYYKPIEICFICLDDAIVMLRKCIVSSIFHLKILSHLSLLG